MIVAPQIICLLEAVSCCWSTVLLHPNSCNTITIVLQWCSIESALPLLSVLLPDINPCCYGLLAAETFILLLSPPVALCWQCYCPHPVQIADGGLCQWAAFDSFLTIPFALAQHWYSLPLLLLLPLLAAGWLLSYHIFYTVAAVIVTKSMLMLLWLLPPTPHVAMLMHCLLSIAADWHFTWHYCSWHANSYCITKNNHK